MAMGAVMLVAVGCGEDSGAAVTRDAGHEAAYSGWGGPCALDPDSGGVVEPYCEAFGSSGHTMDCVEVAGELRCLPDCDERGTIDCQVAGGTCYGGFCLPGADAGAEGGP